MTQAVRNVVNQSDIKSFIEYFITNDKYNGSGDFVQWVKTCLRMHIINSYDNTTPYTVSSSSPQWAISAQERGDHLINVELDENFRQEVSSIAEYIAQLEINDISRLSYVDAKQQTTEWLESIQKAIDDDLVKKMAAEGEQLVCRFTNGFSVWKLTSEKSLHREGERQHNCIGGYWSSVRRNESVVLSLRDEKSKPKVTFELKNKELYEMKETCNRSVTKGMAVMVKMLLDHFNVKYSGARWKANNSITLTGGKGKEYCDLVDGDEIADSLDISGKIVDAIKSVTILGNLNISYSTIKELPADLDVRRGLYCNNTELTSIPEGRYNGNCDVSYTKLTSLPENSVFEGNVYARGIEITVPKSTIIKGRLIN